MWLPIKAALNAHVATIDIECDMGFVPVFWYQI